MASPRGLRPSCAGDLAGPPMTTPVAQVQPLVIGARRAVLPAAHVGGRADTRPCCFVSRTVHGKLISPGSRPQGRGRHQQRASWGLAGSGSRMAQGNMPGREASQGRPFRGQWVREDARATGEGARWKGLTALSLKVKNTPRCGEPSSLQSHVDLHLCWATWIVPPAVDFARGAPGARVFSSMSKGMGGTWGSSDTPLVGGSVWSWLARLPQNVR